MINTYEQYIIAHIASSLSIDDKNLRWFPFFPILPNNNCDLFSLFDVVQNERFFVKKNSKQKQFSAIYGEILQAQKATFVTDIAKKNYINKENWLQCNTTDIPYYSPNLNQIDTAIANGVSYDFTFDSSNFTFNENDKVPFFSSLLIPVTALKLDNGIKPIKFVFKLHFDKVALMPIQYGNWYSSAAFTTAYKNQNNWITESGLITWDSLFGANGILNYITTGVLVASGMELKLQIVGDYKEEHLENLKYNSYNLDNSFCPNVENSNFEKKLDEENNLIVNISSFKKNILMLALQVEKTQQLMS